MSPAKKIIEYREFSANNGRWYILAGEAGSNSRANNGLGYPDANAAMRAHRSYKAKGEAYREKKLVEAEENRIQYLENQGLTRSDAQAIVMREELNLKQATDAAKKGRT